MPKDHLGTNDYIGVVKLKSTWRFFIGYFFEWKLDFVSSSPSYQPSADELKFRGGLLKVDETNAEEFCKVMQPNELNEDELRRLIVAEGEDKAALMFVVDFDNRTYISAYFDYPMEDYAPPGWKSSYGDTYAYVPENIRNLWGK